MTSLRGVEEKILSLLDTSSAAFRCLGSSEASRAKDFDGHSEKFLKTLYEVQQTLRSHINELEIDMPFENELGRRTVEADIVLQGSEIVKRDIERTIVKVEELKIGNSTDQGKDQNDGQNPTGLENNTEQMTF